MYIITCRCRASIYLGILMGELTQHLRINIWFFQIWGLLLLLNININGKC